MKNLNCILQFLSNYIWIKYLLGIVNVWNVLIVLVYVLNTMFINVYQNAVRKKNT